MLSPEAPAPRWRRRLVLTGLLLLFLGLALLGSYAYVVWQSDRDLREAIAEADQLSPGWRLEELEAKRAAIPDEENGALRVLAAQRLLPNPWPIPPQPILLGNAGTPPAKAEEQPALDEQIDDLPPPVQLDAEQMRALQAQLSAAAAALAEARTLVNLPRGRYAFSWGLDPVATNLPHRAARPVAHLLRLDAVLRAQEKDPDAALADGRAALNAGRSIGDELGLLPQLVRMGCQLTAVRSLERTLAQGQPSPQALTAAQQLLEDEAAQPLLLVAVQGERALTHRMLEAVAQGRLKSTQIMPAPPGSSAKPAWRAAIEDYSFAWMMKRGHAPYFRVQTKAVEIARLPVEQELPELRLLDKSGKTLPVLVGLWLPAFSKVAEGFVRQQAWLRSAAVALAMERYRQAHGHWPGALADLVSAGLLRQVPTDPYDGQPLRYRRLADGVVVYSVGPDGNDDGGKVDWNHPTANGADLGFRLWDVGQRRQPPKPAKARTQP